MENEITTLLFYGSVTPKWGGVGDRAGHQLSRFFFGIQSSEKFSPSLFSLGLQFTTSWCKDPFTLLKIIEYPNELL